MSLSHGRELFFADISSIAEYCGTVLNMSVNAYMCHAQLHIAWW